MKRTVSVTVSKTETMKRFRSRTDHDCWIIEKVVQDPIHHAVPLHPLIRKIIDTQHFQRLRKIKQLGGAEYVYPGATHSRFEHSIGVYHLARELLMRLDRDGYLKDVEPNQVMAVMIAALCHDLGHGPYSHLFDKFFCGKFPEDGKPFEEHEKRSCKVFEDMLKAYPAIKGDIDDNMERDIKHMIVPPTQGEAQAQVAEFLMEIVCNEHCKLDVDKFDYFLRDAYYTGVKSEFTYDRIFDGVIVNEDKRLSYRDKLYENIFSLFRNRYVLHKRVVQHRTTAVIERMIAEAMYLVKDHLKYPAAESGKFKKLHEVWDDSEAYLYCTDSVLEDIEKLEKDNIPDVEEAKKVKDAKEIIKKIKERKIWKLLASRDIVRSQVDDALETEKKWDEMMKKHKINPSQCVVIPLKMNHGDKNENPLNKIQFHTKDKKQIKNKFVSKPLLPENFEDVVLLLYSKVELEEKRVKKFKEEWKGYEQEEQPGQAVGAGAQ